MKNILWSGLFGFIAMSMPAIGQAGQEGAVAPAAVVSATGVVQQVKPEQGKVKINHEPIPALGWPPMSMYFRVKDKTVLEGIGAGDKVRFDLEKDAQGLAITRMEKAAR